MKSLQTLIAWLKAGSLHQPCPLCHLPAPLQQLCADCYTALPWNSSACYRCAQPLDTTAQLCGHCLASPPPFHHSLAPLLYQGDAIELLQRYKYQAHRAIEPILQQLLLQQVIAHYPQASMRPAAILPMPLAYSRYWRRGFNQAQRLALPLSRQLCIPLYTAQRTRRTPALEQFTKAQRIAQMTRAFQCPPLPEHIAIVDDVMTSQASAAALTQAALRAGAKRVDIWVVLRTPMRH